MINLKTGKRFNGSDNGSFNGSSPMLVKERSSPSVGNYGRGPLTRRDAIKGGLAAILAAGVAPSLCGSITRGLGYRNLAGRMAAIGGGSGGVSARSYIQDGLLVHFNAKENAGYGVYNPSATTWKDLSGNNRDGVLTGSTEWSNLGLIIRSVSQNGLVTFNGSHNAVHTVEIVYHCFSSYGKYGRILAENQWACCGGMTWKSPYYVYGWGIDGGILTGKYSNTAVAQTIAIRDDGTKNPELFNNGVSEGVFAVGANNLGNATSTLANRVGFGRGLDAAYLAVRIYNRCLTDEELAHNAEVDKQLLNTIDNDAQFELEGTQYITTIGGHAFSGCSGLTGGVYLPACTTIVGYAFSGCSGLTGGVSLPACTTIGSQAFSGCSGLTGGVSLPACTTIGSQAFYGCYGLTGGVSLPACTTIGGYAFSGCSGLTGGVSLPVCTTIGSYAFNGCSGLTEINLPEVQTSTENRICQGCSNLLRLVMPKFSSSTSVNGSMCYNSTKVEYIEFGNLTSTVDGVLIGPGAGSQAPADPQGIRLTVKVKNTMASLRALTYFPFDMPTWGKWVCSDGYIIYENGVWTDHPN